ncbi:MAG TPA: hypothetical protein VF960_00355 [Chloroflexota bacterium]
MSTTAVVAIVIVAIIVVAVAVWVYTQRQKSEQLREDFGPEYDRAVDEYGTKGSAEAVLEARRERVESVELHPIGAEERGRFEEAWRSVEARFVDDPLGAVVAADEVIAEVMEARGYPKSDFEQRVGDLSATHPDLTDDYRTGHEVALSSRRGEAGTEDLRKAMVSYKRIFQELLSEEGSQREAA